MRFNKDYWMSLNGLITVLVICCFLFFIGYALTYTANKPNEAGDAAGLVNGLFSALAFAGVIYAIFLQRNELELQRKELADTRAEFQIQNETLKRQRFENTFFNMLQLQQQITDNITYSYTYNKENINYSNNPDIPRFSQVKVDLKGREVFHGAFEIAPHEASDEEHYFGMRGLLEKDGMEGYENDFTPTYFDHYFRHLYRIFKFVATSPLINEDDRYEYASMVRGQLSRYELIWLYYNGLSVYGQDKFKPLIEKFALLKNLRTDMLVEDMEIENPYSEYAYSHY